MTSPQWGAAVGESIYNVVEHREGRHMTAETSLSKRELLFLTSLVLFESAIVVLVVALHMKGERSFQLFFSSRPGLVFLCAVVVLFMSGTDLVHRYLVHRRSPAGRFRLVAMMNVVSVLLLVTIGEIVVRAGSRDHLDGEAFGHVILHPRSWEKAIQNLRIEKERGDHSHGHLTSDDQMGWTVAPDRCNANGLYCSSSEGIRAPGKGGSFPKVQGRQEIALVGDSFTFGEEVSYEETWGHQLDQMLGDEFQVLNFGVGGYGLGQAFVRYETEVQRRRPRVSIFGFISDDLRRTMFVYPLIAKPHWKVPFSKPRFIVRGGELVNMTPPLSEEIFSIEAISDLPLLEYERRYRARDWQRQWYHISYFVRLLISLFPAWEAVGPDSSDDALMSVNASILNAFVRSARDAHSTPLIVFLPVQGELEREESYVPLGKRVLKGAGISYVDTTPCLSEVNPAERFMAGSHYSPQGNEAVAQCVHGAMKEVLSLPVSG